MEPKYIKKKYIVFSAKYIKKKEKRRLSITIDKNASNFRPLLIFAPLN